MLHFVQCGQVKAEIRVALPPDSYTYRFANEINTHYARYCVKYKNVETLWSIPADVRSIQVAKDFFLHAIDFKMQKILPKKNLNEKYATGNKRMTHPVLCVSPVGMGLCKDLGD